MIEINDLPAELRLKVFKLLSRPDLNTALLVCKAWRYLGEDPSLWKSFILVISHARDVQALSFRRFRNTDKITVGLDQGFHPFQKSWEGKDMNAMFTALLKLPKLKEIERRKDIDLKLVDADLLAKVFVKLEDVGNLKLGDLADNQYVALFTRLATEDTAVKKVCITHGNLSLIEPQLIASVAAKLERIYLFCAFITSEQVVAIFMTISQGTNLKKLLLEQIDISSVDPEVLATAVAKIEKVFLNSCDLTASQLSSVLTRVVEENTKVKFLNMKGNCMNDVGINAVTRAKVKLGDGLELDVFPDTDDNEDDWDYDTESDEYFPYYVREEWDHAMGNSIFQK